MFKISYDKKITMVQGDTGVIRMRIHNYELSQGDEVRFAIVNKANPSILLCQHSDKKIVLEKQVTVFEKDGSARIVIYPYDTEYLQPGKYLYEIQVKTKDGRVDTVVPLTSFTLMDGSIQGEYGQTTPSKPEPTPSEIELRFKRLENEIIPELGNRITNVENETDSISSSLEKNTKNIETREANILIEDDYDVKDISIVVNRLSTELYNKGGGIIIIPAGVYYIKSPIILKECVSMMGMANPYSYDGNTDKKGTMIIKDSIFTDFAIRLDNSSKLFNMGLTNVSNVNGSGVQLYGNKCVVENVTISKFTNDGLQIGDMTTKRNCNSWSLQNVGCLRNLGRGFVLDTIYNAGGPDVNAGLALKCSSWGNGSDGYYLGDCAVNTFLQCYAESNGTVGWRITSKSKRNLLFGCGAEQNTEEQFLFEEGSSNNMYIGQTEFRPENAGSNVFISNTGGANQNLRISHPVYSGIETTFTTGINGGFVACSTVPGLVLYDIDAVDGKKYFDIIANSGSMQYRVGNDNGSSPTYYMRTTKNGASDILHTFNCKIGSTYLQQATTPQSVVKKLPIYNADGSLAGYIPIYNKID